MGSLSAPLMTSPPLLVCNRNQLFNPCSNEVSRRFCFTDSSRDAASHAMPSLGQGLWVV